LEFSCRKDDRRYYYDHAPFALEAAAVDDKKVLEVMLSHRAVLQIKPWMIKYAFVIAEINNIAENARILSKQPDFILSVYYRS